jgi:hypothetical protein
MLSSACATPGSAAGDEGAVCIINETAAPLQPRRFTATVLGPAPPSEVQRQTAIAETRTGGHVSPDYVSLPRILAVYADDWGISHTTIAAVVDGDVPKAGDTVVLESRHRDLRSPCDFIPWTVVQPAKTS